MAYVFDLGDPEGPFTDDENSQIFEFVLGVDPEKDIITVMSVILFETEDKETLELCFGIRTKSVADGLITISPPDYSKEKADECIPKDKRSNVLFAINGAVDVLAQIAKATNIIMETFYPNLDHKALKKYDIICNALARWNYPVEDSWKDESTGINYWLFKKRD